MDKAKASHKASPGLGRKRHLRKRLTSQRKDAGSDIIPNLDPGDSREAPRPAAGTTHKG